MHHFAYNRQPNGDTIFSTVSCANILVSQNTFRRGNLTISHFGLFWENIALQNAILVPVSERQGL